MEFSDPDYINNLLKLNIDSFIEGSSDHLLLVNVKILLHFEENAVQSRHQKAVFKRVKS